MATYDDYLAQLIARFGVSDPSLLFKGGWEPDSNYESVTGNQYGTWNEENNPYSRAARLAQAGFEQHGITPISEELLKNTALWNSGGSNTPWGFSGITLNDLNTIQYSPEWGLYMTEAPQFRDNTGLNNESFFSSTFSDPLFTLSAGGLLGLGLSGAGLAGLEAAGAASGAGGIAAPLPGAAADFGWSAASGLTPAELSGASGGLGGFTASNNYGFGTDVPFGDFANISGNQGFDLAGNGMNGIGDASFWDTASNGDLLSYFTDTPISYMPDAGTNSGLLNYFTGNGGFPSASSLLSYAPDAFSNGFSVSDLVDYGSKAAKALGGNSGAIGGLLGGLSALGQPSSGTTTTTRDIPSWLAPFMGNYLGRAQTLSNTPQDPLQQQAYQGAGTQGQQDYNAASGWLQGLLGGTQTNPYINNPHLEQSITDAKRGITENYRDAIMPSMNAMYSRQGAFGGSAYNEMAAKQADALNRNLSETETSMRNADFNRQSGLYENQLQRQLAGVGMSPSIANLGWGNLQNTYNFGQQNALWPAQTLDILGNAVRTGAGTGAGSTSEPWQINKTANVLAGAAGGAQLGSNLQGFWDNIWKA